MSNLTKRILVSVGELSGDMHTANLVKEMAKVAPHIKFYGMGSTLMQEAGVEIVINANALSVMGGVDIILKFSKIRQAFRMMEKLLLQDKPDLLLLVDYPGFNLRLAKIAKKAGVKVLYYISPKIWAWHQSRVKIIKQYVDVMAVIFPFEVEFYKKWKIPAVFVGNPLLKTIPQPRISPSQMRTTLKLEPQARTIGLFPGSRSSEIKRLLPVMLNAAKILKAHDQHLQFVLPQAHSIAASDLAPYLQEHSVLKVQVIVGQSYEVMQACDAIIAASGTVTLEIALMEVPLVIIYKMAWLEYQIAKRLIKIPYVGLCNILAGKLIAPELLQHDATPKKISAAIERILHDELYRHEMLANLKNTRKLLAGEHKKEISAVIAEVVGSTSS